jgi:hypothetical protein
MLICGDYLRNKFIGQISSKNSRRCRGLLIDEILWNALNPTEIRRIEAGNYYVAGSQEEGAAVIVSMN